MRYLIDGYNLMFALGLLGPGTRGRDVLPQARLDFLHHIADSHGGNDDVTVVFDGRKSPGGPTTEIVRGMEVVYAPGEEADDVIERRLRDDPAPRHLAVVSGDRRIRDAARRRGATHWDSREYFDHLDQQRRTARSRVESVDKPGDPTAAETAEWLRVFGHIEIPPQTRRRRP